MMRRAFGLVVVGLVVSLASAGLAQEDPFADGDDPFEDAEDPFAEYERQVNETTNATQDLVQDEESEDGETREGDNASDDDPDTNDAPGPGVATALALVSVTAWLARRRS